MLGSAPTVSAADTAWRVLAVTLAVQVTGAWAMFGLAAIAPEVGQAVGVSPVLIGYQVALAYGSGAITALLAGPLVRRAGACRGSQTALLLLGTGSLVACIPSLATLGLASLLIGLGYGFTNPAASHLLARFTPPQRRNLMFSIKQTGVPLGGIVAGLAGPALAVTLGWQAAPAACGATALVLMLAIEPAHRRWDDDRDPAARLGRGPFYGLRLLAADRALLWLALGGTLFSIAQFALVAFLVAALVGEAGLSLILAGAVLSAAQAAGVAGRLVLGWFADRIGDGLGLMLVTGTGMMLAGAAAATLVPAWGLAAIFALFVAYGFVGIGWTGIFMAELARFSPKDAVGAATGGALFVLYVGVLVGPSSLSELQRAAGSYGAVFLAMAAIAAAGLIATWRARTLARRRAGAAQP